MVRCVGRVGVVTDTHTHVPWLPVLQVTGASSVVLIAASSGIQVAGKQSPQDAALDTSAVTTTRWLASHSQQVVGACLWDVADGGASTVCLLGVHILRWWQQVPPTVWLSAVAQQTRHGGESACAECAQEPPATFV